MAIEQLLPIIAAVVFGIAILIMFVALNSMLRRDADMDTRMNTYLGGTTDSEFQGRFYDPQIASRLNATIKRQGFAARIEYQLLQANVPLTVSEYLLLRLAIPFILSALALLIWREVLLVPFALLAGYLVPLIWMQYRRKQRNRDFGEQLPETLDLLTASMRGGFSLIQAFSQVASDSQEPTKSELQRVFQEVQLGLSMTQAIDNLAARMESDDMDLVATAIKIHSRVGGNLGVILENISSTIRERTKLRRDIRVITSMQRISSYVIGALPFALAGIIFAINPAYMMKLFQPGLILCIPIGALIMSIAGFLAIQRIIDIKI
ncbi:MAG TPA: type II secretion system F family protein [Roseiflexaceae bacterium]|nr:type II secretion system F family protein [Roseiflexaceae bacterium]HMP39818.1 type II secretion system F family protein [Roseiflexaceae bacterium]